MATLYLLSSSNQILVQAIFADEMMTRKIGEVNEFRVNAEILLEGALHKYELYALSQEWSGQIALGPRDASRPETLFVDRREIVNGESIECDWQGLRMLIGRPSEPQASDDGEVTVVQEDGEAINAESGE